MEQGDSPRTLRERRRQEKDHSIPRGQRGPVAVGMLPGQPAFPAGRHVRDSSLLGLQDGERRSVQCRTTARGDRDGCVRGARCSWGSCGGSTVLTSQSALEVKTPKLLLQHCGELYRHVLLRHATGESKSAGSAERRHQCVGLTPQGTVNGTEKTKERPAGSWAPPQRHDRPSFAQTYTGSQNQL